MGFYVWQLEADVRIPASVHDRLLEKIKDLHRGGSAEGSASTEVMSYRWVDSQKVLDAMDLGTALDWWRWAPSFDADGNIVNLRFRGQKAGRDELLFETLAPFVEDGSFIVIEDEDGAVRRWYFKSGECHVELLRAMDTTWRQAEPS